MNTKVNLTFLETRYIFFYGINLNVYTQEIIALGTVQGINGSIYTLYAISKRINMARILEPILDYFDHLSSPGDCNYYDYIPDIMDQVLQIAAQRSLDEFNLTLQIIRNHPKIQEWYKDDEEGTLEVLEDGDTPDHWYNYFKNYSI